MEVREEKVFEKAASKKALNSSKFRRFEILQKTFGSRFFPIWPAPMVGLTHFAFRSAVRRYLPAGARLPWPTEMLNSRKLPHEKLGSNSETLFLESDSDLFPQLLANEEEPIRLSVKKLEDWGVCGIDINMGCPVNKALRHNYGVALMGDPDYAKQVVDFVRNSTKLPVSVKLRAGSDDIQESRVDYLVKFIQSLVDAGADWIVLHPRLSHQMRRGVADWKLVGEVAKNLSVPVIGNGDLQNLSQINEIDQMDLPIAGVMIGRALTARPWLLGQWARHYNWSHAKETRLVTNEDLEGVSDISIEKRNAITPPFTAEEEAQEALRFWAHIIDELEGHLDFSVGGRKFRFLIRYGASWLDYGHTLMKWVNGAKSYCECKEVLARFSQTSPRMLGHTRNIS
ncbi:MAG: nitrogen fixation protein NifR [Bdellovibrionales bacterium CG10_big_fil_rev_8_21_14_0_10_45_34]|nr:MAG: nitrogen fixation protein NifR [Bdellovibrionales bacterium CG10_big_fil_rev_8_21_14_0_10_45_34]